MFARILNNRRFAAAGEELECGRRFGESSRQPMSGLPQFGLRNLCVIALLLRGGIAAAASSSPAWLNESGDHPDMNMHIFFRQPGTDEDYPAPKPAEPERILIRSEVAGATMEMAVFDPTGDPAGRQVEKQPSRLESVAHDNQAAPVDAAPRRPGKLGRKGSAIYGYQADFFLHTGYRQDQLDWNIAAPNGSPNVLSELKWENQDIALLKGDFSLTSPAGWHVQGKLGYGWIADGENQDSDYAGDHRSLEFSRSNNQADRGHVFDASFGFGYRFGFGGEAQKPWFSLTPLAGYAYREQSLSIHDGVQTVSEPLPGGALITPPVGPFNGLNSRYETEWRGPWLGLGLQASILNRIDLFAEAAHHWTSYDAQADWNLRKSFAHPRSFMHSADGMGVTGQAGVRYRAVGGWSLEIGADYQRWQTDPGKDEVFFINGASGSTRLNEVNWGVFGVGIGFGYVF